MATTTATTSATSLTSLDSTYQKLIDYQIQMESAPLTKLETQQKDLIAQRAIYSELKTKLDALRASSKALVSTDPFYTLKAGRTVSVSNIATGTTVISAAASSTAVATSYEIKDISLALADRVRSDQQEYSDQALNKSGTIIVGGAESRSLTRKMDAVSGFTTGAVGDGNSKLEDGSYFVETKKTAEGNWQFRLVNSSGTAQSINGSGTDGWQNVNTSGGAFDTGRGLIINFGTDLSKYLESSKSNGSAAKVDFTDSSGIFSLNNVSNTSSNALEMISAINTNDAIATGQKELGKGSFFVETRLSSTGIWQFRLVDSDGIAEKIANGNSTTNFTNSWQSIPTDGTSYSTGRGISIDFGTDSSKFFEKSKMSGATTIDYQSKGAEVIISASMSLNDIAYAINKGTYASGNELTATVVNRQLVISSKLTGASHKIQASGSVLEELGVLSGSSFKNVMQSAKNATFTVNGLQVTRAQNSALTDVISGVTLNLASDAEGKSATLDIASDNTSQKNAINSLITNFNELQSFISTNTALTKKSDGTYTRGPLSGDQSITSLRSSLFGLISSIDSSDSGFKSLSNIGITIDSNLKMSISNSTKLESALNNNYSDVIAVMDRVMSAVTSKLDKFTGTTSYVDQLIKANATKTITVGNSIVSLNKRLDAREQVLIKYYADMQSQMDLLTNTQNTNNAWITSLYANLYS